MDSRGWSDVAYSYLVCQHGHVFEGRGPRRGSAANGSTKANADWLAVCALTGGKDVPTPALLAGIGEAIAICRAAGAGRKIIGHRDLFATACPGDALYARVAAGHWSHDGLPAPVVVPPVVFVPPVTPPPPPPPKGALIVQIVDLRQASATRMVTGSAIAPMQRLLQVADDGKAGPATRKALGMRQVHIFGKADFIFGEVTASALLAGK